MVIFELLILNASHSPQFWKIEVIHQECRKGDKTGIIKECTQYTQYTQHLSPLRIKCTTPHVLFYEVTFLSRSWSMGGLVNCFDVTFPTQIPRSTNSHISTFAKWQVTFCNLQCLSVSHAQVQTPLQNQTMHDISRYICQLPCHNYIEM